MERRDFLKRLAAAAAAGSLWRCAPRGAEQGTDARPNVLFLYADQLRPDMLGPYGGSTLATPHIDALARQGMTFNNALSTCPLCAPYRGMLMTGRYPTHSGILLNRIHVSPAQNPRCLAQLFSTAGYATGYLGKWHLSAGASEAGETAGGADGTGAKQDENEPEFTPPGPQRLGFRHWEAYNYHTDFRNYWFYRDEPQKIVTGRYETDVLTDQAIAYMHARVADGRPFLLVVAPHPPHPPFTPAACPTGYLEQVPLELHWRPNVPAPLTQELALQVRCYLAMIKHLDDCVGRLVRFLDDSGLSASTLFVLTSDHGEMHGSHGLTGKTYPYAESVNIPLLLRWPGRIPAGGRATAIYTPFDHLPTLCTLAGIDVPSAVDGTDLSSVLLGRAAPERDGVLIMNYTAGYSKFKSGGVRPEWRGVHTDRHTYVKWLDGREALFENAEDPFQQRDLIRDSAQQPLALRLRARFGELLTEAHDEFLPGTAYAAWYTADRSLVRTALGPVP